jgi:catechol-2,3-dioxygenase
MVQGPGTVHDKPKEQEMPKIRHLAIICMDPEKLAKFYSEVFEMKIVARNGRNNVFLTDGYMNLALLSQKAEGKQNGLNHFGFHVEASWKQMSDATLVCSLLHDGDRPSLHPANQKRSSSMDRATRSTTTNYLR